MINFPSKSKLWAVSAACAALLGAAVVMGVGVLGASNTQAQGTGGKAAPAAKAATPITAAAAAQRPWPIELRLTGAVSPWHEAVVNARSSGLPLIAVLAEPGQRVASGQVLARFDDRQPKAELAQAQATADQLQASLEQAQTSAQRVNALRGTGAVSEESVLQALTLARTTQAQLQGAQAAVEAAQLRLEHTVVRAPDSGTVTQRSAALGQTFAAGGEMFRLMRQYRLEWRADVNTAELARLKPGQTASVELADGQTVQAKLRQIAPALNASNRMAIAQFDLPGHELIKPSMLLQGKLRLGEGTALVVPAQAVVLRDGRAQVFVIDSSTGKPMAKRVYVQTGRSDGAWIQVTGELKEGEQVAVRGAGFLSDGEVVQVQSHEPAPTPKASPASSKAVNSGGAATPLILAGVLA